MFIIKKERRVFSVEKNTKRKERRQESQSIKSVAMNFENRLFIMERIQYFKKGKGIIWNNRRKLDKVKEKIFCHECVFYLQRKIEDARLIVKC